MAVVGDGGGSSGVGVLSFLLNHSGHGGLEPVDQALLAALPCGVVSDAVAQVGDDAEPLLAPLLLLGAVGQNLLHRVARGVVLNQGVQVGAVNDVGAGLVGV